MSVLSSKEISRRLYLDDPRNHERIFITPIPVKNEIKDASVDLMLGNYFVATKSARFSVLDATAEATKQDIASYQDQVFVPFDKHLVLHPGTFVLGVTWQYIGLPNNLYAQVFSRSTWGRAGLTVATAVSIHPGFCGCLTLELVNNGNAPIALHPGTRIAQIVFFDVKDVMSEQAIATSKYCGMTEPDFSRLHEERQELEHWQQVGRVTSFREDIKKKSHQS